MSAEQANGVAEPPRNCALCPRLVAFRNEVRACEPDWHNAPVPTFGDVTTARILIVGLAPGLKGANRTGRPFTGDDAGNVLYGALTRHGLARGTYAARPDDGLTLIGTAITNAVRCVPPQNKPVGAEIAACRSFLTATLAALPADAQVLALGRIAHEAVLRAETMRLAARPFAHGAAHRLPNGRRLTDSYHPSRYNMNTGVLTEAMFDAVIATVADAG